MSFADEKQPFWPTFLAFVTALATLLGAVGGIVATAAALTGGGDGGDASPPASAPATGSSTPSPVATPSLTASAVPSPSPRMLDLDAKADSSWSYPATPSENDEHLTLDWGCSGDSRGNGSKQDCGSGIIAVRFDMGELPKAANIQAAVLTLHSEESGGSTAAYARLATTQWKESDPDEPPDCDPADEVAGEANGDQWSWDITTLVRDQRAAGAKDLGLCLVLKTNAGLVFDSREGAPSTAPSLTITYR